MDGMDIVIFLAIACTPDNGWPQQGMVESESFHDLSTFNMQVSDHLLGKRPVNKAVKSQRKSEMHRKAPKCE